MGNNFFVIKFSLVFLNFIVWKLGFLRETEPSNDVAMGAECCELIIVFDMTDHAVIID